jgi:hypothetical protein
MDRAARVKRWRWEGNIRDQRMWRLMLRKTQRRLKEVMGRGDYLINVNATGLSEQQCGF